MGDAMRGSAMSNSEGDGPIELPKNMADYAGGRMTLDTVSRREGSRLHGARCFVGILRAYCDGHVSRRIVCHSAEKHSDEWLCSCACLLPGLHALTELLLGCGWSVQRGTESSWGGGADRMTSADRMTTASSFGGRGTTTRIGDRMTAMTDDGADMAPGLGPTMKRHGGQCCFGPCCKHAAVQPTANRILESSHSRAPFDMVWETHRWRD